MSSEEKKTRLPQIAVGITGASGVLYGTQLLKRLAESPVQVHLIVSEYGIRVLREEVDIEFEPERPETFANLWPGNRGALHVHSCHNIGAAPATGSEDIRAFVICPCSMSTLGRLAGGISDNLITRMGGVALKERRPLILVPRETPLSTIHLRNMVTLSEAGAVVMPACPGFYQEPRSVNDLVGFMVDRVMQHLRLPHLCSP